MLKALDGPHVLSALEGAWVGTAQLAHAALELLNGFVAVILHPFDHAPLDRLEMIDGVP